MSLWLAIGTKMLLFYTLLSPLLMYDLKHVWLGDLANLL